MQSAPISRLHLPAHAKWVLFLATSLIMGACGDVLSGTGELGKVNYSLYTVYLSETSAITQSKLLAGHPQHIMTELTLRGSRNVEDPGTLTHVMTPSEGVVLSHTDDGFDVPDVRVNVSTPGDYTLETQLNGEVFDRISLSFAKPERLDVITWVKLAQNDNFEKVSTTGSILVTEGTQVSVIPVPITADGERIMGDFEVDISASPAWAMVATENIFGAYEQGISSSGDPVSLVFIEPGEVEVTVRDAVNDVEGVLYFSVESVPHS